MKEEITLRFQGFPPITVVGTRIAAIETESQEKEEMDCS